MVLLWDLLSSLLLLQRCRSHNRSITKRRQAKRSIEVPDHSGGKGGSSIEAQPSALQFSLETSLTASRFFY
jgi:hypothetical protein